MIFIFMLLLRRVWHTFLSQFIVEYYIVPVTGKVGNEVLGNTGGGNVDFDGLLGVDLPVASMLLLLLFPVKFDPGDCLTAAGWGQPWPPCAAAAPWPWFRLFRSVTNSVLRDRNRCCKCTASFEQDASARKNRFFLFMYLI